MYYLVYVGSYGMPPRECPYRRNTPHRVIPSAYTFDTDVTDARDRIYTSITIKKEGAGDIRVYDMAPAI